MKKLLIATTCLVLILGLFQIVFVYASSSEVIIPHSDDFNNEILDTNYWIKIEDEDGVFVEQTEMEIKVSGVSTNTTWYKNGLRTNTFPKQGFQVSIDYKLMSMTNESQMVNLRLYFADGDHYFGIGYDDAIDKYVVTYKDVGGYHTMRNSLPAFGDEDMTFHTLKIIFNASTNTASGYVDNILVDARTSSDFFTSPMYVQFHQESNIEGEFGVDYRFDNFSIVDYVSQATCNSCEDCSSKLASGMYVTVTLTSDLLNIGGSCIQIYDGESNVVFDCAGHTIDGDDMAIDSDHGISMMHGANNKIMNCKISDFISGIYLWDATHHTIVNNTTTSNGAGIRLGLSDNNTIHTNTSHGNSTTGVKLENSDNNTINSNVVCDNSALDFSIESSTGNTGDNNTCDTPDGWNDQGTTGCTSMCAGTATCNSCTDCTNKLNGVFDHVMLTTDINNYTAGTCIFFGVSNVEFDCNHHTIDGDDAGTDYGILISEKSGNTIKNCEITDFSRGIGLSSASNNTVEQNITNSNTYGIKLYDSTGNTIQLNEANSNTEYGIHLSGLSNGNTLSINDLRCNDNGMGMFSSDSNVVSFNTVCSREGPDIYVSTSSGTSGHSNSCDTTIDYNDAGATGCATPCNSQRCATCSDGIQNGDEDDVDCGGSYCPPCSQCTGEPTNKYAPPDTVCNNKWPTSDGPNIGMNTTSDSCDLVEVCDPNLDFIIEDALLCCEHTDYASRFAGHNRANSKINACNDAHASAYNKSFISKFNQTTLKQCLAHYIIQSFGKQAVYMQGYFYGEGCCYGSDICPSGCSEWYVSPPAWQMGTSACCAEAGGAKPDFQMGNHRCEYYWTWFFTTIRWGKDGYWKSDTNYQSNNDSFADIPSHASINRLSTGTCVDYSFALTTMLRKAGYSKDDIFSVHGSTDEGGHAYNLLRLPGESKWHYVDTVGNNGGGIYGGSGYPTPTAAWYKYCKNLDGGCSNDVYGQSRSHCPSNNSIYGCESVVRSNSANMLSSPTIEVKPAPVWPYTSPAGVDQTCTELNPCTGVYTTTIQPPGPAVDLEVYKTISSEGITLGEDVVVTINISNQEETSIDTIVRETFSPGIDYDLDAQQGAYEAFTFQYHTWDATIPAQSTRTLTFTAKPKVVGYHSFAPTSVSVNDNVYNASSQLIKVVCNPNGSCDSGETYIYCPQDCITGIQDDYCDMVSD
ncbi:MAG: right-handed parallel beta-helix repeat-containing protein, partial [Anaerolineae bacterium]|nr:right-handed parallel beta-helix repeat-containing protein [Anaerolineae bacterium]